MPVWAAFGDGYLDSFICLFATQFQSTILNVEGCHCHFLTISPMLVPISPGGPGSPYMMDEAHIDPIFL